MKSLLSGQATGQSPLGTQCQRSVATIVQDLLQTRLILTDMTYIHQGEVR